MIPDILIIEEEKRRREQRWEPVPLYAPSPIPRRREPAERPKEESRSSVIIIDISDYSESTI